MHHMQFHFSLPFVQTFCGICQVCGAQWWRSAGVFVMGLHTAIPRISILTLSCPIDGRYCHNAFCTCLMSGVEQSFCGHGLWWKRKSPQNLYDFKSMLVCLRRKLVHLTSHLCGLHAQSPRGSWVPVMMFCGCVLQAAENPELLFFFYHVQANITTNVMHWPLREFIRQPLRVNNWMIPSYITNWCVVVLSYANCHNILDLFWFHSLNCVAWSMLILIKVEF